MCNLDVGAHGIRPEASNMDERVEIIDVPQSLQPHPGAGVAITRPPAKADLDIALTSDEQVSVRQRIRIKWTLALVSLLSEPSFVALYLIIKGYPPPLDWASISLMLLCVLCACVSLNIKTDRVSRVSIAIGCIALLVSVVVFLLIGIVWFLRGFAAQLVK